MRLDADGLKTAPAGQARRYTKNKLLVSYLKHHEYFGRLRNNGTIML